MSFQGEDNGVGQTSGCKGLQYYKSNEVVLMQSGHFKFNIYYTAACGVTDLNMKASFQELVEVRRISLLRLIH